SDYILSMILAEAADRGEKGRDDDALVKLLAYLCGPEMLDCAMNFVAPKRVSRDNAAAYLDRITVGIVKSKAALAALKIPVNNWTHTNLIEAFARFLEIEHNAENAGHADSELLESVNAMVGELPFGVRGSSEGAPKQPAGVEEFDARAAELRSDEMLQLAAGFTMHRPEALKDLCFPRSAS